MTDRTGSVFGNEIDRKTIKAAEKSKIKYIKKYGDDSGANYILGAEDIGTLDFIGAKKLVFSENACGWNDRPLIVGNIRMGFGHYRISIAMASCARALGFTPYWLDLAGFDATGSKMIADQNKLYSMGSKLSQKSRLFNAAVWEPLNSEGFRKLTYNAKDQKNSELLVPILSSIPKDVPYIATHVWPSQAAVHAGMVNVVNAIPDNWPMALHLSEGAVHTVQTQFAYLGYKTMNGFSEKPLKCIPDGQLKITGRYVDHELLAGLDSDNAKRAARAKEGRPMRFLLTVGGAGAGYDQFLGMVSHLIPYVKEKKAALFINFGDHRNAFERFRRDIRSDCLREFQNDYALLKKHVLDLDNSDAEGICAIFNDDIFEAVYSTNLLMPKCDVLITKPSELAYYPIPKLFMKHIGGHEVYGAICSQEAGDGTFECPDIKDAKIMIDRLITEKDLYCHFVERINTLKAQGEYDGGYNCVRLAAGIGI